LLVPKAIELRCSVKCKDSDLGIMLEL
jgi:hypothetical protein